MKRPLLSLLALLCGAAVHAQDNATSASTPAVPAVPGDLRVDADWIRLPHRTAARLLAETSTAKDMAGLREKVVQLVASGEAARVDLISSALMEASEPELTSGVWLRYPDSYWPPTRAFILWPDGRRTPGELAPMIADAFETHNLGRAMRPRYSVKPESGLHDYEIGLECLTHETNQTWGRHPRQRTLAIVFQQRIESRAMPRDFWHLTGILTPPPAPDARRIQDHADRLLVFTRVTGSALLPPVQFEDDSIILHVEWIEADMAVAARLLEAHPDTGSAGSLRRAVEQNLADGTARLLETAGVSVKSGQRSLVQSGHFLPFCHRHDAGGMTECEAGTHLECELSMDPNRQLADVNLAAELRAINYTGVISRNLYPEAIYTQRNAAAQLILRSGEPALMTTLDPLPDGPNSEVAFRPTRKLLVFVRAIF